MVLLIKFETNLKTYIKSIIYLKKYVHMYFTGMAKTFEVNQLFSMLINYLVGPSLALTTHSRNCSSYILIFYKVYVL